MNLSNGPGIQTNLTQEVKSRILACVPEVLVQNQVAYRARIPKQTLSDWLKRGERDLIKGENSIFAQLSDEYHLVRTEFVKETLNKLKECPKNYQALTWLLEKCFREDFGAESEELRELKALFMQIIPTLGKEPNHGSKEKAEEMDSKSN